MPARELQRRWEQPPITRIIGGPQPRYPMCDQECFRCRRRAIGGPSGSIGLLCGDSTAATDVERAAPGPTRNGNRQLIVRDHVGALLRLAPARGDHHRDLGDAELPGGEHPGVARDQPAVLAHQRRRRPAPLLDAGRDSGDLRIRVGSRIVGIRDQPVNRPPLDLVGRPRSLIFRAVSRAGARVTGGEVLALLPTLSAGHGL